MECIRLLAVGCSFGEYQTAAGGLIPVEAGLGASHTKKTV